MAVKKKSSIKNDNDSPKPPPPGVAQELPKPSKMKPSSPKSSSKPVGGIKPDGGVPNGPKGGSKGAPQYKVTDPNFPGYKKRTQDPQQKPRTLDPSQGRGRGKAVPPRPAPKPSKPRPSILNLSKKKGK